MAVLVGVPLAALLALAALFRVPRVPNADLGPLTVRVRMTEGGELTLSEQGAPDRVLGTLSHEDLDDGDFEAFDALRTALLARVSRPETREADGSSLWTVEFALTLDVRVSRLHWLLQTVADPAVRIIRVRFLEPGASGIAVDQELPRDEGLVPPPPPTETVHALKVRLLRRFEPDSSPGPTVVSMEVVEEPLLVHEGVVLDAVGPPPVWEPIEGGDEALRIRMGRLARGEAPLVGLIETNPPRGSMAPYGAVFAVLRAFRDTGITDVRWWGMGTPFPKRPRR